MIPNNTRFYRMLGSIQQIVSGKKLGPKMNEARNFLSCAYGIFSSWKPFFSPSNLNSITPDQFWAGFETFLSERGNGSWSQLKRHKNSLKNNREKLLSNIKTLINTKNNFSQVLDNLRDFCDTKSRNYFKGQSLFLMTGILFASDEDNFMVIDGPVRRYFFPNKRYASNEDMIKIYSIVIVYSEGLSNKYSLSMWHIYKAYAVLANGGKLDLKRLGNNGRTCIDKNTSVTI
ncbi:MAG: hypothetical protein ACYCT2_09165 [Thermoplasmataceae archaeon]